MFRSYLAAALRNLGRNRLYAGVTIAGLAIGFAAALLIGLFVRDEYSYDRWIPGAGDVYAVSQTIVMPGSAPIESESTPMMLAPALKLAFPRLQYVARLSPSYFPPTVRHGAISTGEQNLFWADPDFFRVVPLPAIAGDPAAALDAPDSIVITRTVARKYFGRDRPLGETLLVDRQPMRVTAVLEDLPSNTHLTADIFVSTRSAISPISQYEAINGPLSNTLSTYFRLRPGDSVEPMLPTLPGFLSQHLPLGTSDPIAPLIKRSLQLVPLTGLHMHHSTQGAFKPAADPAVVGAIAAVGALIVLVAAINFVTLMTARAGRRAVEVGVRKAAGAARRDLIVQFMGEALLQVLIAALLAMALAELLLPAFNAFLQRDIAFDYLRRPELAGAIAAVVLVTGLLAGAYPALVLSSFAPASVLKGGPITATAGGGRVRQALVVMQFAVLIMLVLTATTISRQTLFAVGEGMRLNKDQVALIFSRPCSEALRDQARRLPGVLHAGCAFAGGLALADNRDMVITGGRQADISTAGVDFGFFEVFGIHPLAGRLFDPSRPADGALDAPDRNPPVVINETAARRLGFASPAAAVGATVLWRGNWDISLKRDGPIELPNRPSEVIGVVPDFTLGSVREPIRPMLYAVARNLPPNSIALAVKLDGRRLPETLAGLDRIWKRVGNGEPMLRVFADQFTLRLYIDTIIQGATIALAALIALSIAALGLFALSAYVTERRTKEIGVRKAMGAGTGDILKLLLWEFTVPVLLANLVAWPAGWLVMNWWLKGFAYHVDLAPWTFLAASLGALVIAWTTVFVHALKVARARPVGALRYE
jgi:putative ABC transport system permease protein